MVIIFYKLFCSCDVILLDHNWFEMMGLFVV